MSIFFDFQRLTKIAITLIISTVLLVSFDSCTDPKTSLDTEIRKSLRDGEGISTSEWQNIKSIIDNNESLGIYADNTILKEHIHEVAKKSKKPITSGFPINVPNESVSEKPPITTKPEYNIYIENSGSMFGYINGVTEFKDAVMNLQASINRHEEEQSVFFVNDDIYPVKTEFDEFHSYLKPSNLRKIGDTRASNIAKMLSLVLERAAVDDYQKTSILYSDFIFSLRSGSDIENDLANQKYGVQTIIQNAKLKDKGISFLILKFNSKFDGTYYDVDNRKISYSNLRPYYVWVIGKVDVLRSFVNKYDVKNFEGYEDFTLICGDGTVTPYYSILKDSHKKGNFKIVDRKSTTIKSIYSIDYNKRSGVKEFQFGVGINCDELGLPESYIKDKSNYLIESEFGDDIRVADVIEVNKKDIGQVDQRKYIGSSNHVIILSTEKVSTGKQKLNIVLKDRLPQWVGTSSTTNDRGVQPGDSYDKTFGFEYLIEGIAEAYKPIDNAEKAYFNLDLEIER